MSDKAKKLKFDPQVTINQECLVTTFQECYYESESFQDAKEKMRQFALKIKRPFAVRYNPYNQTIEILSNHQQVSNVVSDLKSDICIVFDALKKIEDSNSSDDDMKNRKNLKFIQKYKKLEEAFKNLSLDFPDESV